MEPRRLHRAGFMPPRDVAATPLPLSLRHFSSPATLPFFTFFHTGFFEGMASFAAMRAAGQPPRCRFDMFYLLTEQACEFFQCAGSGGQRARRKAQPVGISRRTRWQPAQQPEPRVSPACASRARGAVPGAHALSRDDAAGGAKYRRRCSPSRGGAMIGHMLARRGAFSSQQRCGARNRRGTRRQNA